MLCKQPVIARVELGKKFVRRLGSSLYLQVISRKVAERPSNHGEDWFQPRSFGRLVRPADVFRIYGAASSTMEDAEK